MTNLQINNIQNNNISSVSVTKQNFRGIKNNSVSQDTVEISGKKKSNNLGLKILLGGLGIAGIVLTFVKFHKTTPAKVTEELSTELKEVQQIYKDIFKRDISAEETKDFAKRYKAVIDLKTPDNDREYCEKLLDELCKDRKTKRPRINRWVTNPAETCDECKNASMATAPDGTYIDIWIYNYHNNPDIPLPERALFETLFHETHHVKQDEMIYRTNRDDYFEMLVDKFINNGEGEQYQEMLLKNGRDVSKTVKEVRKSISENIDKFWGGFKSFVKDSAEYKEGIRLLEGKINYKSPYNHSFEEYSTQVIEKGAFVDGEKAERLFDILKSITI